MSQLLVVSAEALKVEAPRVWNGPGGMNVTFSVLPIHHAYGLHTAAFKCFMSPTTLVLLPKWNADVYFDSIPKYRVTSLVLVPSLVHQIVHHPRFPTIDFSTVQTINCGAAHLPVSLAEQLCSRIPGVERMGGGE
jgi:acyl-CoA synthetase (AMP-forming)/AMP-acid ligase II